MAATGAAGQPASTSTAQAADEPVTLVVHTAKDCPVCKLWRESASGLAFARQWPERWPQLQVVVIERKSLHGSETGELYPAELQYLFDARQQRYQLSPPVPLFEIVRNKQLVARQAGLQGWSQGIVPALQELEASRNAGRSGVAPVAPR